MRYLLDTNVVSELRKVASPQTHPRFVAWAKTHPAAEAISAVTLFELEIGVQRIERRDPTQGVRLRRWLEGVQMTFDGSILPLDADVAVRAARFHVPDPRVGPRRLHRRNGSGPWLGRRHPQHRRLRDVRRLPGQSLGGVAIPPMLEGAAGHPAADRRPARIRRSGDSPGVGIESCLLVPSGAWSSHLRG